MKTSLHQQTSRASRVQLGSLLALLLLIGAGANIAEGQPIYKTGFEPPTFANGPLVGQNGWIAPPPLSPNAAMVTSDMPRQGRQTVHVLGSDLEHQDFIGEVTGGYYDAIGSYRHGVDYDTHNTQKVLISANVRIDGPRTPSGNNFFSASIAAIGVDGDGNSSGIGELALSSDGHAYGYSSQDLVPTFLCWRRVTPGEWHNLAVLTDFTARTYSFFVDGQRVGTFSFDPSATSSVLRRGSLLAYVAPDTATNTKADYAAHYDNFSITAVSAED